MGEFASAVQHHLHEQLAASYPEFNWKTEHNIAGTPVDVAGLDDETLILIELEWRRADPADNSAKLFRHLSTGTIEASEVVVFHVFTGYYDLTRGGVSSKRKNAEFVGHVASGAIDYLSYYPVDFDFEPPKRGEEWPDSWQIAGDAVVNEIQNQFETHR
ncbi:hypothetical protein [Natrinema salaciae]|uniref:hypothetical protein n=1 Tax=Natrinema salaciae TaxID=1186196 RepID=UPI000AAEE4B5|nr:hypothetical protein [Natrinema salaciae]